MTDERLLVAQIRSARCVLSPLSWEAPSGIFPTAAVNCFKNDTTVIVWAFSGEEGLLVKKTQPEI